MATKAKKKAAAPSKKAVKKEATPANAKKPRTGVGAFIKEQLQAGKLSAAEIADEIKKRFPESKAGVKEVSWYRSKLAKA